MPLNRVKHITISFFIHFTMLKFIHKYSKERVNMDKNKKILLIGGIVEGLILVFCLVVSILVLTRLVPHEGLSDADWIQANMDNSGPFIGTLQTQPPLFFCTICIPVFLMVAVDFVYFFIIANKRESNLSEEQMEAIKKKAEEEVRDEIMKEMLEGKKEEPKEEPKENKEEA